MTTWSDWILLAGCDYPESAVVQLGNPSRFRVPIGPDGWSDWIGWKGGECPVPGQRVIYKLDYGVALEAEADGLDWSHKQGVTSNIVSFCVRAAKEEPAKQGPYYVSVVGMSAPTKAHDTLESAVTEAQRLGKQPANMQRDVMVFQLVATLPPAERKVVMVGEEA